LWPQTAGRSSGPGSCSGGNAGCQGRGGGGGLLGRSAGGGGIQKRSLAVQWEGGETGARSWVSSK